MSLSGPADAWRALDLPVGECDPKAIRRAYARCLRQHRPEDDPAGFRRVRDAYEMLTEMPPEFLAELAADLAEEAESAAERGDMPPSLAPDWQPEVALEAETAAPLEVAEPGAFEPAPPYVPVDDEAPDAGWRALLVDALGSDPDDCAPAVQRTLSTIVTEAGKTAEGRERLLRTLVADFSPGEKGDLAAQLAPAFLARCLDLGEPELPVWALTTLARTGQEAALTRGIDLILENGSGADWPESLYALLETARSVAVFAPNHARKLLDAAWEHATGDMRRMISFDEIDDLMAVGHEVAYWRTTERALLTRIAQDGEVDLMSEDRRLLNTTRVAVLRSQPDSSVRRLVAALAPRLVPAPQSRRRAAAKQRATPSASSGGNRSVYYLAFGLFMLFRLLSCSSNNADQVNWQEQRRRIERNWSDTYPGRQPLEIDRNLEKWRRLHDLRGGGDGVDESEDRR